MSGKARRMRRILIEPQKRCLCVPMDHGLWVGPMHGIENPRQVTKEIIEGGATSTLLYPGFYREVSDLLRPDTGLILRVSAITSVSPNAHQEVLIAGIDEALAADADAVAVTINMGGEDDLVILSQVSELINECRFYGMPVLAEMLPVEKPYDPSLLAHSVRIAFELGADIVKTYYPGDPDSFRTVVEAAPIPIVIAGGEKIEDEKSFLSMVEGALAAGGVGVATGRNVWQSENPGAMVERLRQIVFGKG